MPVNTPKVASGFPSSAQVERCVARRLGADKEQNALARQLENITETKGRFLMSLECIDSGAAHLTVHALAAPNARCAQVLAVQSPASQRVLLSHDMSAPWTADTDSELVKAAVCLVASEGHLDAGVATLCLTVRRILGVGCVGKSKPKLSVLRQSSKA